MNEVGIPDINFRDKVYQLVATIPKGKVMTYGDVAGFSGHAYAARIVGGLAHFGPTELPWQRVVNRFGGLAAGYPGGREAHKYNLEQDGIEVGDDFIIKNFEKYRWKPSSL